MRGEALSVHSDAFAADLPCGKYHVHSGFRDPKRAVNGLGAEGGLRRYIPGFVALGRRRGSVGLAPTTSDIFSHYSHSLHMLYRLADTLAGEKNATKCGRQKAFASAALPVPGTAADAARRRRRRWVRWRRRD